MWYIVSAGKYDGSTIVYSLVETAKMNGLNTFSYLQNVLLYMPGYQNESEGIEDGKRSIPGINRRPLGKVICKGRVPGQWFVMKILMDARTLGRKPSGIGIYTYNMVLALQQYTGYEIILATDVCGSEQLKSLKGIRILSYGTVVGKNLGLFKYCSFLQQCIEEVKPDIFWECNNFLPQKIRNPYGHLWTTVHDIFGVNGFYGLKYKLYSIYGFRKAFRMFDTVIYNSYDTKEKTEERFPQAKKLSSLVAYIVIPKVPERKITDNDSFLYLGNLEYRKGTDLLLEKYRDYKKKGGTKKLRVAGKIREEKIRQQLIEAMKEDPDISSIGYLEEARKYDELASCHAFVFPSRAEGFGIPLIEAMQYYKPLIASNLPVFREITDGLAGEHPGPVDKEKYDACTRRYLPEAIAKKISEFITGNGYEQEQ